MMNKCIKCGSYAFNLYKENIDQGAWCDVHYWQGRAHRAEFLAEQPAQQEPVAWMYQCSADSSGPVLMQNKRDWAESSSGLWTETPLYTAPQAQPAQRKPWVGLTESEKHAALFDKEGMTLDYEDYAWAIEAKLKEKNT